MQSPGSGALVGFGVLIALTLTLCWALLVGGARSATPTPGLIAFTRYDGTYVMRPDGSGVRRIRRIAGLGLAWSPDGRKLAFTHGSSVFVMNADGTQLVRLTRADEWETGQMTGPPTWSPDGRKIAFTAQRYEPGSPTWARDIWIVRTDGTQVRRLAKTTGLLEYEVDWSPNGRRIAFSEITGRIPHLYVMNTDGSHPRLLAPAGEGWFEALSPAWSPDGRRIAFTRRIGSSTRVVHAIWVLDPRTRVGRSLSPEASIDNHPTWSPDGGKIAFVRGGGKWADCIGCFGPKRNSSEIYVMNADGTGVTRLTHNTLAEADPAWQPLALP